MHYIQQRKHSVTPILRPNYGVFSNEQTFLGFLKIKS